MKRKDYELGLCLQKKRVDDFVIAARIRMKNKKIIKVLWYDNIAPDYDHLSGQYFLEGSLMRFKIDEVEFDKKKMKRLMCVRTLHTSENITDKLLYGEIEAKLKSMKTRRIKF